MLAKACQNISASMATSDRISRPRVRRREEGATGSSGSVEGGLFTTDCVPAEAMAIRLRPVPRGRDGL